MFFSRNTFKKAKVSIVYKLHTAKLFTYDTAHGRRQTNYKCMHHCIGNTSILTILWKLFVEKSSPRTPRRHLLLQVKFHWQ